MNMAHTAIGPHPHVSVAPMMDWTDRHCRYFHRLLSPHVRLYTEMVTTGALIHGDRDRYLRYNAAEHPLALQLGGSEPEALAECARMAADYGYDEINLNCGCPSERVQKGAFGACLMAEPDLVARCVEAMTQATPVPVTVKCRIGIDNCDAETFLRRFIKSVSGAGCTQFIIHARQAWLKGLSPKENREIPPLNYDLPFRIKRENPKLQITLNGGICTTDDAILHLERFDGVMIGRAAYHNPGILGAIERSIFQNIHIMNELEAVLAMIPYIEEQKRDFGTPPRAVTRHMLGLFQGMRGSRRWRRILTEPENYEKLSVLSLIKEALNAVENTASA